MRKDSDEWNVLRRLPALGKKTRNKLNGHVINKKKYTQWYFLGDRSSSKRMPKDGSQTITMTKGCNLFSRISLLTTIYVMLTFLTFMQAYSDINHLGEYHFLSLEYPGGNCEMGGMGCSGMGISGMGRSGIGGSGIGRSGIGRSGMEMSRMRRSVVGSSVVGSSVLGNSAVKSSVVEKSRMGGEG